MFDSVYGIPLMDILKIKATVDKYMFNDVDSLLECIDIKKVEKTQRDCLLREIERINEILKEGE